MIGMLIERDLLNFCENERIKEFIWIICKSDGNFIGLSLLLCLLFMFFFLGKYGLVVDFLIKLFLLDVLSSCLWEINSIINVYGVIYMEF